MVPPIEVRIGRNVRGLSHDALSHSTNLAFTENTTATSEARDTAQDHAGSPFSLEIGQMSGCPNLGPLVW